jgi:hypothetical protein
MVLKLGREQSKPTKELLHIATRHTSGKEAVRVVFIQGSGKVALGGAWGASTIAIEKGTKWGIKSDRREPRRWPQRIMVATSRDEENNDKDVGDYDEELMAAAEHDFKREVQLPVDHYKELLKETCPNHIIACQHKLKVCTMMKKYMTMGSLARSKKAEGDPTKKAAAPLPEEKAVLSIYSGSAPMSHATNSSSPTGRSTL